MVAFQTYPAGTSFAHVLDQLCGANDSNQEYMQYLYRLVDGYDKRVGIVNDQPLFMIFSIVDSSGVLNRCEHLKILDGQGLTIDNLRDVISEMGVDRDNNVAVEHIIERYHLVKATTGLYYNKYDLVENLVFDENVYLVLDGEFTFVIPDHSTFEQGLVSFYPVNNNRVSQAGYSIGSYVTVKTHFTYEAVESIGSNFSVEGRINVTGLADSWFNIGENSRCQDITIRIPPSTDFATDFDLNLPPLSLHNLTVENSILVTGGAIGQVSNLTAKSVNIDARVAILLNVQCKDLTWRYANGVIADSEVDNLTIINGLISKFPDILIKDSLKVLSNYNPIDFVHTLVLQGDLEIKARTKSLPKNSVIMGKTFLNKKSQNNTFVPESFCSLGGIHFDL